MSRPQFPLCSQLLPVVSAMMCYTVHQQMVLFK